MNSEHYSDIDNINVGNPEIDEDHHALAQLIHKVANVCKCSLRSVCDCDNCPESKPIDCFDSLVEIGHEIMLRMIEHFHHEEELMKSLRRNRVTRDHCVAHKQEHVNFSTRYNQAVSKINANRPVVGLRTLETFIIDWVRSHVLEYDMKLAALLETETSSR